MRHRTRFLLALFVASSASCDSAVHAQSTFRGNPARTGAYEGAGAANFGGFAWRFRTDGPVRGAPTPAADRIYVASGDGHVYALDRSGRKLWQSDLGAPVMSTPTVADDRVFAQTSDGRIHAVSAADGASLWVVATGSTVPWPWGYESGDIYTSSPAVVDGTVYVGSRDGHLYALSAQDGSERWKLRTEGRVVSSPAVAGGVAVVGSADGSVYAADVATGTQRWRFDTDGRALDSGEFGFDRRTVQSSPAIADNTVFIGARDGILYAVDLRTGREKWRADHQVSWVNTSPAVADNIVVAGSSDARFVHGVDARTGRELWRQTTPAPVWSSPAIARGLVYFGDSGGNLHVLDLRTGERRWTQPLGGTIFGGIVVLEDMVLIGNEDGAAYALRGGARPLQPFVYFEQSVARQNRVANGAEITAALEARGFRRANAATLSSTLERAISGGTASVTSIVFATDLLPDAALQPTPERSVLRRFLDAGGTIVWLGVPPGVWPFTAEGTLDYTDINRATPSALLDIDFTPSNFDRFATRATDEARAWGLDEWWRSSWAVADEGLDEVLARNEFGIATAWVKRFGGAPGTGFVMLGLGASNDAGAVAAFALRRPMN